jgi:hypothetical protein
MCVARNPRRALNAALLALLTASSLSYEYFFIDVLRKSKKALIQNGIKFQGDGLKTSF